MEKELYCDLTIQNSDGPRLTPDLLVEEIREDSNGEYAMITYIADDNEVGDLIPLSLTRIKNVILKEPYQAKE